MSLLGASIVTSERGLSQWTSSAGEGRSLYDGPGHSEPGGTDEGHHLPESSAHRIGGLRLPAGGASKQAGRKRREMIRPKYPRSRALDGMTRTFGSAAGKNRPAKRTFTAAPAMTAWKRGRIRLPSLRRKPKTLHTFYKSSLLDFTFRQYPESVDRRCPGKAPAFPQYASIEIMSKE